MKIYNIHEAKTHLSKLLEKVLRGEEVILAKSGTPIARITPYKNQQKRKLGIWSDKKDAWISDDFNETNQEIINMFEGKYGSET